MKERIVAKIVSAEKISIGKSLLSAVLPASAQRFTGC